MSTIDVRDIRSTIIPKSDQLNAEQLLTGERTVMITEVVAGATVEQPLTVHYVGEEGRPYKPCKTMRRVMAFVWGNDATAWVGKSMTLFCDPDVKFGGEVVGGIRISHMSGLERTLELKLTEKRGAKKAFRVRVLTDELVAFVEGIKAADTAERCKRAFSIAWKATPSDALRARLKVTYDQRMAELAKADAEPVFDIEAFLARVTEARDEDGLMTLGIDAGAIEDPALRSRAVEAIAARRTEVTDAPPI